MLNSLENKVNDAIHPDDITSAISHAGYEIKEITGGAEEAKYEIVN